jgi:WhiB family transcriptional regulator, redox-sensing transcriptional regulator
MVGREQHRRDTGDVRCAGVVGWQADGACLEHLDLAAAYFPERGDTRWKAAQAICRVCLVQSDCLAFALDEDIAWGVWGGSTGPERLQLRRRGVTGEMVRRSGVHRVDSTISGSPR